MSNTTNRGRYVWYDLMTNDLAAATQFYTSITKWGTEEWKTQSGSHPYQMWTVNGKGIGGMMPIPTELAQHGVRPHWIAYVSVPNVDETAKQITELGGKLLHPPMDIPTVGRFATFADPQGAVQAAFTPAGDTPGRQGDPRLGDFMWHELLTSDRKKAFDFYSALYGWELIEAMDMGAMGSYDIYGYDGIRIGGMFNAPGAGEAMPPHWCYYISVENVDQLAEQIKREGGQVLNGPMDVPGGGRILQCQDPQGAVFAVHSMAKTP